MRPLVLLFALTAALAQAETPETLIRALEARLNADAKAEMVLVSVGADGQKDQFKLTSYTKANNQKIIVRFQAPARMVGNDLIMLDRNVWSYDAASGREIKIPSNQSFGGTGFSYGDVLRLNFSDNYAAVEKSSGPTGWTLELTAKDREAPYYRIVLDLGADKNPLKGTCLTRAGAVVKTIEYSDVKDLGSGPRPVTITVRSPLNPQEVSTLTVTSEVRKSFPDNIFNKRNLATHLEDKL